MTKKLFLIVSLVLIFALGFFIYAYVKINRPASSDSDPVSFSVPKGASTKAIGEKLEAEDLISSTYVFVGYAMFTGANGNIQAGDYQLDRNMTMKEILSTLESGKVTRTSRRVTIVEGRTNEQVAERLVDAGLTTESLFQNALKRNYDFQFNPTAKNFDYQGFLFPDTYEFNANWSADDIVSRMLENFETRFTDQMLSDMQKKNLSIGDVMVMASIIEKEVGRNSSVQLTDAVKEKMQDERESVASVFYNRLEIGMPLQSDATVNYITGKSDRRALIDDTKINSPYNTYQVKGLPPGPISNPGIGAIRAAIYPAETDYLYFLNNKEGVAYFARTLEEHNSNRAKYLD